jgi:glutamate-1-semialdehyde 2,1-aminomutase
LDFLLGSGPLILGHAPAPVVEAIQRQARDGTTYYALNRPAIELAELVASIPGCVEQLRFVSTGTEATMHAIRLARAATGRRKLVLCHDSYHGSHDTSIVAHLGKAKARAGGVPDGVSSDVLLATFDDTSTFDQLFRQFPRSIAAVMLEPMQRCIQPSPGFLESIRRLAHEYGALVVFDEVMTGFRVAFGGAQERFGVVPDLVCYGKILGGGLPMAAVGGRRAVMQLADATDKSRPFVHVSGTMNGNPLAAAAGLATLTQLHKPGMYTRLEALGERLRRGLREQIAASPVTGEVRGVGPLAAVSLPTGGGSNHDQQRLRELTSLMLADRILVQLQTRFYVSAAHTEDDIDRGVEVFGSALRRIAPRTARTRFSAAVLPGGSSE